MRNSTRRLYADFGELVVLHRRRSGGMTQAELGQRIGLSRTSVTNIEQGRHHVSLERLLLIAEALDVAPATLLPAVDRETGPAKMAELLPKDSPPELVEWAESVRQAQTGRDL